MIRHPTNLAFLLLIISLFGSLQFFVQVPTQQLNSLLFASSLSSFREDRDRTRALSVYRQLRNTSLPYVTDVVCGSCRHTFASEEDRCGLLLQTLQQKENLSVQQAAARISHEYPDTCKQNCLKCSQKEKRYWRYDRVTHVKAARTYALTSVPSKHRLPSHAAENVTAFFSNPDHTYPVAEYLFEYNPSIVKLPQEQMILVRGDGNMPAVYLASFRVSNRNFCFHPSQRRLMVAGKKVPAKDWLGLALLDKHLKILVDSVVDLKKVGFPSAEDFRLFSWKDQIYVSSYDLIAPLWVRSPPAETQRIPNVFGDLKVFVRNFTSCAPCSKQRGYCGKNLNYFVDANHESMVELWPSPPHVVRGVDLQTKCKRNSEPSRHYVDEQPPVKPSFATVEELYFPSLKATQVILTRGRGGACCIELSHNSITNNSILVGIQHSKTPSQRKKRLPSSGNNNITDNHYLSRFYAFEATAPYHIVARSGFFCLGFPTSKLELDSVPLVRATLWRKLVLGEQYDDCPRIHFVSGMTIKADDPSTLIIAYGINDCIPRMVEMEISEVQRLLFGKHN